MNVTIWSMPPHLDYSSGYLPWEDLQGQKLVAYTCFDAEGRLVKITPKIMENHSSWLPIQADPAFHYNLGMVISQPDTAEASTSQDPQAIHHRQEGEVLIYGKKDYIINIDSPSSGQYTNTTTTVVVKYTDNGNYSLTSNIFRSGN